MKTTIPLFCIVVAFLFATMSPQVRATCQDACLTNNNTVQGDGALLNLTTGTDNTALGFNALLSDTTGSLNVAVGSQALASSTTGGNNIAIGGQALFSNQDGFINLAMGYQALYENISGSQNIAIGDLALYANKASNNTAVGFLAARLNASGNFNTAVGFQTLYVNQGSNNCAFGAYAMGANVFNSGSNNTGVGTYALFDNFGSNNTAIGYNAGGENGGNNNIFIGISAGADIAGGANNIYIGHQGIEGDNGIIRIGSKKNQKKTYIVGINGNTVAGGIGVIVGTDGRLGTTTSSARFKENIKPMDNASEAILALKPVTFRYKQQLDPEGIPQFGLVAEEVEKVNPNLVARDEQGKPYSVRYEAVNVMLLNEFLKEHRKVKELEAKLAKHEKDFTARLKEQDAKIQEVNDKMELSKPAPRAVLNNQ